MGEIGKKKEENMLFYNNFFNLKSSTDWGRIEFGTEDNV